MISALYNQKVIKRPHMGMNRMDFQKKDSPIFAQTTRPKSLKGLIKYPIILVLSGLIITLFLSTPNIFSLTLKNAKPVDANGQEMREAGIDSLFTGYPADTGNQEEALLPVRDPIKQETPEIPPVYKVQPGDTVYEIAEKYSIPFYDLIRFNRIEDPTKLQIDDSLLIPQGITEVTGNRPSLSNNDEARLPDKIAVAVDKVKGTAPLLVHFKLNSEIPRSNYSYMWDFGNDRFGFDPVSKTTYESPGVYNATFWIYDKNNKEIGSNKVTIRVTSRIKEPKVVKISTANAYHITLSQVNDILDLSKILKDIDGNPEKLDKDLSVSQSPVIFQKLDDARLLSIKPGYSRIKITGNNTKLDAYVFVSPIPTKHSFEPDYEWYKTQFGTGLNANCGPASVAMAIYWAKGTDISVKKVRSEIGMPYSSGGISFEDMFKSFNNHRVKAFYTTVDSAYDLKRIIDNGNIAIILYHTSFIKKTKDRNADNMTGRYYDDLTGHYSIVKGYSRDMKYFVVYDPIPSDWDSNNQRYDDGFSMLGKNRYYPVNQVMAGLKDRRVIEVTY
ncbi:MAG: LysM peptidoglycan-binding domain-containing protein [Spirochaetales bacterium]|nr:LysM peptidoglycan-binding domain-containing protein [Spirochaetales bacterium]